MVFSMTWERNNECERKQLKPFTAGFALKPSYVCRLVYTLTPPGFKSGENEQSPFFIL